MLKPCVALISHAYLEKQYRGKLPVIGQAVDLTVISPDHFPSPFGLQRADFVDAQDYAVRVYPCVFPLPIRTSTRFSLVSRDFGFCDSPPDIIYIENEESSFVLFQALLYHRWYAPKAKIIVFVWANLSLTGIRGVAQRMLARWARSQVDFYIAGSSEAKYLLVKDGISIDQVAVFPCVGSDTTHFRPATLDQRLQIRSKLGLSPDEFVIGFVGRFESEKGVEDLLSAFCLIREDPATRHARLICVGDGSMRKIIQSHQPDVLIFSSGSSSQVLPYYQAMDVLVLPSRTTRLWKEQFGRVIVEAMACGVAVIGSDSGAIPEVIGSAGLIFHEGNIDELRSRLSDLMKDSTLCQTLAKRGQARVIEEYSDLQIAIKTLKIYSKLVSA